MTIDLPDDIAKRAEQAAAERGITVDELAREAMEAYLDGYARRLSFVGLGDAEPGFEARRAEAVLESEGFEQSHSS